ncbi:glycosyltransferase family 39 protein [Planomonospora venezuelensis]|uniref:glycosyltransferase family 39 protein n=1 Tax=Planomonospora venezuelensis TaxID=1999 RepID=UPI003607B170
MIITGTRPAAAPAERHTGRNLWPYAAMGIIATVVAVAGSSAASLSSDELATHSAARRGLGGLWELAQHIDGHFLPYYGFMHLWLQFGQAEWWMRLPSALATGAAAMLVAVLGRRLHSLPAGLLAAAVYAALPAVSYHGQNARSYAFAAAAAVLATWALHRAVAEPARRGRWAGYAAAVALLGSTQVFSLLTLSAHLIVVAMSGRGVLVRTLPAMAAGCVPGAVWLAIGFAERHAISWIKLPEPSVFLALPKMVGGTPAAGWVLAGTALLALLLRALPAPGAREGRRTPRSGERARASWPWLAALAGWALLPPVLLFAVSHLVSPVYVDRYLFATVPAYALLAGIALASLPRAAAALALAGAVAAAVPGQLDVRKPDGRHENFPRAVRLVEQQARPGDAIVYGRSSLREGFLYYDGGALPDDVLLTGPDPLPESFHYPERDDVAAAVEGRERVWVVWRGGSEAAAGVERVSALVEAGFTRTKAWRTGRVPGMTVALYGREPERSG